MMVHGIDEREELARDIRKWAGKHNDSDKSVYGVVAGMAQRIEELESQTIEKEQEYIEREAVLSAKINEMQMQIDRYRSIIAARSKRGSQ